MNVSVVVDGVYCPVVPPELQRFVAVAVQHERQSMQRRNGGCPAEVLAFETQLRTAVAQAAARSRTFADESKDDELGAAGSSSPHEIDSRHAARRIAALRSQPSFSAQAVTLAARQHRIPARKVGRSWWFAPADVEAFAVG